ncbi:MAG: efflux RND transporter periplasmic adaptor subunit [Parachlamydiales bacterium]
MRISPLVATIIAICLVAAGVSRCASPGQKGDFATAVAAARTFPIEIGTVGELDSIRSIILTNGVRSPEPRKITYAIPDGSPVEEGQLLLTLDAAGFESKLRELTTQIEIQEAEVEASQGVVEAEAVKRGLAIERAELEVKIAEVNLDKTLSGEGPKEMVKRKRAMDKALGKLKNQEAFSKELMELQKEGLLSPKEISTAKGKQKEKEEIYQDAKLDYEFHLLHQYPCDKQVGQMRVEIAKLEAEQAASNGQLALMKATCEYQQARFRLAELKGQREECIRNLKACEIRAPKSGCVVLAQEFFGDRKRKVRVGDPVFYSQPLAEIPDPDSMAVKAKVPEGSFRRVEVGMPAYVTVDAHPGMQLQGEIVAIGGVSEGEFPGEKVVELTVALQNGEAGLRPGMTARCLLVGEGVKGGCTVPAAALFHAPSGPFVYKQQGSRYRVTPVTLGKSGDEWVEITSGLKNGERVALQPPADSQVTR